MGKKFQNIDKGRDERAKLIEELTSDKEKPKRGRKKKHTGPTRTLNINIEAELYEAFQNKCDASGRTMTYEISEFMKTYIKGD